MVANRGTLALLIGLFAWSGSAWAQYRLPEPEAPIFDAPKLQNIVIDGKADDWQENGLSVGILGPEDDAFVPASDLSARMRLGWDDRGMLVLVYVQDDKWIESRGEADLWRNDGIEMFLSTRVGGPDWCQWIIAPGMEESQPAPRSSFSDHRSTEALKKLEAKITVERTKTDAGYVLEALLPWSGLAIEPKVGAEVGLQVIVNDVDKQGEDRYFAGWYPGMNAAAFSSMNHRVRLAEKAGDAIRARIYCTYDVQQMRPVLLVTAPMPYHSDAIEVSQAGSALGNAELKTDDTGWARARVELPTPPTGKPYLGLEVTLSDSPESTVSFPASGLLAGAKMLVDKRDEIVKQYAVDQPWNDMSEASALIRRHRGMIGRAYEWLDTTRLVSSEKRVMVLAEAAEIVQAINDGKDFLGAKRNEFTDAYYSTVDGSGQPMVLWIPADYDPSKAYPLSLILHGGGGRPEPTLDREYHRAYLAVQPWARGDTGYRALGEQDVLAAMAYVRQWYNVDDSRIYVDGGSMGGLGTWTMSTRFPDTYAAAAPLFGTADGLWLENLRNVPIFVMHGGSDWVVAVDHSRYAISKLQQMGYFAAHKEFPAAGHFIPTGEDFTGDWMLTLTKPKHPKAVTYTCESEDRGKAYWLNIRQFVDPHQPATVKAEVLGKGLYQLVTIWPENVNVLELDVAGMDVDPAEQLLIQVGLTHLTLPKPLGKSVILVQGPEGWKVQNDWFVTKSDIRPYRAGAAAHLFMGEPLLIVRGTIGGESRTKVLAEAADRLSRFSGVPGRENTVTGKLLVMADTDVTPEIADRFNLILLGSARDNQVTAYLSDKLPYKVNRDNQLVAGDREPVDLAGAGIRLAYYNPLMPRRLIFLIATDEPGESADEWLKGASRLLTGSGGEYNYAQADLVVQTLGGADRRRMQFGHDWQWTKPAGADQPAPEAFASAAAYRQAVARVLQRTARADYAFAQGASDESQAYDAKYFKVADLTCGYTDMRQTVIATISGADLIQLYRQQVLRNAAIVQPEIDPEKIDREASYRIALPPSLTGPFSSRRQKNLTDVEAGPDWKQRDLWKELLGQ